MGLFEISEEKKRAKEIRKEGKNLRKLILSSGLEKKQMDIFLEEFLYCVEQGACQQEQYYSAKAHMESCLEIVNDILPQMRELPEEKCKECLQQMLLYLPYVYHECLIRKDDLDYDATLHYMNTKVPAYTETDRLMMQSELENLKAVFDDAMQWAAPDFMALAYFLQQEGSTMLADMENTGRNSYIERIYKERFWNENAKLLEQGNVLEPVEQFARTMLAR